MFPLPFSNKNTVITKIKIINNPPMEAPIIIGVESGLSVTVESFVVKRSVKSKNVVSIPSVQDISITYSEVVLT
jgi:hypothetical protein